MTQYAQMRADLKRAAALITSTGSLAPIRVIGHLDADGISASAIIVKALLRLKKRYALFIVQQLDEDTLRLIDKEKDGILICADVGSGQFSLLRQYVRKTKVIILDHHELDEEWKEGHFIHINPHLYGIKNSKEISGAGLAYLLAREMEKGNLDLARLALIGLIADGQDHGHMSDINRQIIDHALTDGSLTLRYGLRIFGHHSRPLHKALEYESDHPIPGVTRDENGALAFLAGLGIESKKKGRWRTLADLDDDEYKALVEGVLMRRAKLKNPQSIIGPLYSFANEPKDSPLHDVRECCTLINACGRLGKASMAIGALLGDEKMKQGAIKLMSDYKRELSEVMRWYQSRKGTDDVQEEDGALILSAHDAILPTMIGTVCSVIARSGRHPEGLVIIGLSRLPNKLTKVSFRRVGQGIDLFALSRVLAEKVSGRAGGHKDAAGAIIPTMREPEFIALAKQRIKKLSSSK